MGGNLSNRIDVLYPNGVIAFSFDRLVQSKVVPVASVVKKTNEIKTATTMSPSVEEENKVVIEEDEMNNFQIAVVAESTTDTFWNLKNSFLIVLGLGFFVGVSLVFSRRQKVSNQFEIE